MLQSQQDELERKNTLNAAHEDEKTQLQSIFESEKESLRVDTQKQIDLAREVTI